jgi:hypothetical protein
MDYATGPLRTKVSLIKVSSCSKTGSIRDDPYWTSRKNSLELTELSSIKKLRKLYLYKSQRCMQDTLILLTYCAIQYA